MLSYPCAALRQKTHEKNTHLRFAHSLPCTPTRLAWSGAAVVVVASHDAHTHTHTPLPTLLLSALEHHHCFFVWFVVSFVLPSRAPLFFIFGFWLSKRSPPRVHVLCFLPPSAISPLGCRRRQAACLLSYECNTQSNKSSSRKQHSAAGTLHWLCTTKQQHPTPTCHKQPRNALLQQRWNCCCCCCLSVWRALQQVANYYRAVGSTRSKGVGSFIQVQHGQRRGVRSGWVP